MITDTVENVVGEFGMNKILYSTTQSNGDVVGIFLTKKKPDPSVEKEERCPRPYCKGKIRSYVHPLNELVIMLTAEDLEVFMNLLIETKVVMQQTKKRYSSDDEEIEKIK